MEIGAKWVRGVPMAMEASNKGNMGGEEGSQ